MILEPLKAIKGVDSFEVAWCRRPRICGGRLELELFRFEWWAQMSLSPDFLGYANRSPTVVAIRLI